MISKIKQGGVKDYRIEVVLSAFLGRWDPLARDWRVFEGPSHGVSGVALGIGLVRVVPHEA